MYDREDGCLIIGVCVCGSIALTLMLFSMLMGHPHPAPGRQAGEGVGQFALVRLGAWVFTFGLVVAEAVRGQKWRPRK